MADLIAIGCPDVATADAAAGEARRLASDLIIQPDPPSIKRTAPSPLRNPVAYGRRQPGSLKAGIAHLVLLLPQLLVT